MQPAPPFITHREIDTFLGGASRGAKQRQRMQRLSLLPEPESIKRVQRFNLLIYPRFALAGLIGDFGRLTGASELTSRLSKQVFASAQFRELADELRGAARELPEWRYDVLIENLVREAHPAVRAFGEVVERAEAQLQERFDISFAAATGIVRGLDSGLYVVSVHNGTERIALNRVAAPVSEGRAVAVERVKVVGTEQDFLMPSVIEQSAVATPVDDDAELVDWFAQEAQSTPALSAVVVDAADHLDVLPYRRSTPRRRRARGAGLMRRVGALDS